MNDINKSLPTDNNQNSHVNDLASQMLIDVAVNEKSEVWAFHNKPFPNPLQWAEYDAENMTLNFITNDGQVNPFGVDITPEMDKRLQNANTLYALQIDGKTFKDVAVVPLMIGSALH